MVLSWHERFVISIHALRKESDGTSLSTFRPCQISIHALRKESDSFDIVSNQRLDISIHALRKESDARRPPHIDAILHFNPRSP